MTVLLYRTPPHHRTHHDPSFFLSPATFKFELALVVRAFVNRIATHDEMASKYIVGHGHKLERERLEVALRELESAASFEQIECPESVAANFAFALGSLIYDRFTSVHCDECGREFVHREMVKSKWGIENPDGSGSSGSRLGCPKRHFVFANIESVRD